MKEFISDCEREIGKTYHLFGKKIVGLCHQEERHIKIDYRDVGREILNTMIHEEVHSCYPEYNERETIAWTNALHEVITPEQRDKYYELYMPLNNWHKIEKRLEQYERTL